MAGWLSTLVKGKSKEEKERVCREQFHQAREVGSNTLLSAFGVGVD
jgi:hypothetical protein